MSPESSSGLRWPKRPFPGSWSVMAVLIGDDHHPARIENSDDRPAAWPCRCPPPPRRLHTAHSLLEPPAGRETVRVVETFRSPKVRKLVQLQENCRRLRESAAVPAASSEEVPQARDCDRAFSQQRPL